jgi:hypothetical protein
LKRISKTFPVIKQSQIDSKDYFGEFLFALDFDDYLKYIVEKRLVDYLADIKVTNSEIEIDNLENETKNLVKIIIEVDKFSDTTVEQLEKITSELQLQF